MVFYELAEDVLVRAFSVAGDVVLSGDMSVCTLWVTGHEFASHWQQMMRRSPGMDGSFTHVDSSRAVYVGLGLVKSLKVGAHPQAEP